jgi:peroxiredoxin Q/BCP
MPMNRHVLSIVSTATLFFAGGCTVSGVELKVADPAPPFALQGSDGKTHSLKEFAGKKAVVVAWFPKAFTGG